MVGNCEEIDFRLASLADYFGRVVALGVDVEIDLEPAVAHWSIVNELLEETEAGKREF